MTPPCASQACLESTLDYHCTAHSARQAFLCDYDHETNKNYGHRRAEIAIWGFQRIPFV